MLFVFMTVGCSHTRTKTIKQDEIKLTYHENVDSFQSGEYIVTISYSSSGLNAVDFNKQLEMVAESKAANICGPHNYKIEHSIENKRAPHGILGYYKWDTITAIIKCISKNAN